MSYEEVLRVCESLRAKGLVRYAGTHPNGDPIYVPTQAGFDYIAMHDGEFAS